MIKLALGSLGAILLAFFYGPKLPPLRDNSSPSAMNTQLDSTKLSSKEAVAGTLEGKTDQTLALKKTEILDLSRTDLTHAEVDPWISQKVPAKVYYFNSRGLTQINAPADSPADLIVQQGILFISQESEARRIAQERQAMSDHQVAHEIPKPNDVELESDAYELVSFSPGFRDDHETRITSPKNIAFSITGPDFSLKNVNASDASALEEIKSHVVSFGHNGEMVLRVKNDGFIMDQAGADFSIFENVFRFGNRKLYQEFARVGVSEINADDSYVWFDCNPKQGVIRGCAGVVPTNEGGDLFDLAQLGLKKIKFIKIQDVGYNFNLGENTEGFDLDALKLFHAFRSDQ